jgi:hypothetical protein
MSSSTKNNTSSVQNMIMVTLGLPGKQLMLYLTTLPASGSQTFKYHLRATMPVTASDGGAEVSLYCQPKQRSAAKAVTLQVTEAQASI